MISITRFESAVCVAPRDAVRAARLLSKRRGWGWTSIESTRVVDRFVIIAPLTSGVPTIGLEIDTPSGHIEMHAWTASPTSAGSLHHIEWKSTSRGMTDLIKDIVIEWALLCPRAPWRWSFGERSRVGYLLSEFRKAKRAFKNLGFEVKRPKVWPPENQPPFDGHEESSDE
ncbi:MAG TPA: hypothetical protein QF646_00835 [Candidatus Poseidoniales archaeon]|nr:hypothetical protein [Candidatus Poseidoniales archaeon]